VIVPLTALCVALSCVPTSAAVVNEFNPTPTIGVPYRWAVEMSGIDTATFSRHVGAWSWEDNSLFDAGAGEPPVGWTHTSDWAALLLTEPATLTLRLERDANVPWPSALDPGRLASTASMFPSFTIWSQLDQDTDQLHTYNNRGDVSWAEDLVFLDYVDNSTATSIEESWTLPAGQYTFALGSNAPADDTDRQGYRATLTTTAPIPEPAVGALLLCAGSVLGFRRGRRVR
jgi:hypothetical protein